MQGLSSSSGIVVAVGVVVVIVLVVCGSSSVVVVIVAVADAIVNAQVGTKQHKIKEKAVKCKAAADELQKKIEDKATTEAEQIEVIADTVRIAKMGKAYKERETDVQFYKIQIAISNEPDTEEWHQWHEATRAFLNEADIWVEKTGTAPRSGRERELSEMLGENL